MDTSKLGDCEVCDQHPAKYTCPGCATRSCSLPCVKTHKFELACNGMRNKAAYKSISEFSNLDLLSDYRLLEDIGHSVHSFARDPSKRYTRSGGDLPKHLFKLRDAVHRRDMRLWFLPQQFTRHAHNTTYLDWKTKLIQWRLHWIFPKSENSPETKLVDERVLETNLLSQCLVHKLNDDHVPAEYTRAGLAGITLLLRAENVTQASKSFYNMELGKSLRDNLEGHTLVEYPILYVVLKQNLPHFTIITLEKKKIVEIQNEPLEQEASKSLAQKVSKDPERCNEPHICDNSSNQVSCGLEGKAHHSIMQLDDDKMLNNSADRQFFPSHTGPPSKMVLTSEENADDVEQVAKRPRLT